ncbi:zinc finger C-x8-C-x5-C-x3-H type family protein isoform X2 [Wolffia australiana]
MSSAAGGKSSGNAESEFGVIQGRKDKRKALKKLKRKEIRRKIAAKEREEEEALANDPEEQLRIRLRQQEELEAAERERKAFEEREKLLLHALAERHALEEAEKQKNALFEASHEEEVLGTHGSDYEDGPAEIIWKGNEIIVKKKKIKVPKQLKNEEVDRPTSNPFPPQPSSFDSSHILPRVSAQELLENVAQQVPNFGTEQDKAHCPFHLKTGACRFGVRCSRVHFYPDKSCTILIRNMYSGPGLPWDQDEGLEFTEEEVDRCYEEFYEDVHTEFLKFGEVINFKVCRNSSSHLRGNVYIHYKNLESSIAAYNTMNARYYAGKQTCSRGTACNFIHCFRNPGGDYEWADLDKPPPKYWMRKMAVLFGTCNEVVHNYDLDLDNRRRPSEEEIQRHDRHKSRSIQQSRESPPGSSSAGDDKEDEVSQKGRRQSSERRQSERRNSDHDDCSQCRRHRRETGDDASENHRNRASSQWGKRTEERRRLRKHTSRS